MAQDRKDNIIKSDWFTPKLGAIAVGYICANKNFTILIQVMRFNNSQIVESKNNYLVK